MSEWFPYQSARAQLAALASREISAAELLELHVQRHAEVNPAINAVIRTDLPAARARAQILDRKAKAGALVGPLHGLPITVKDTFDVDGMPATAGAPEYVTRPRHTPDSAVAARLKAAGAVIWGKTNTPYLAGDNQTFNEVYGRTSNPWDLDRTPGGSSGGAAAALALGVTPLEVGSDIGGSLRLPAHFCGVAALKPTFNRVPIAGHVPPAPGTLSRRDLNVAGPMARTVSDLRLLFDIIADRAPGRGEGPETATLEGRRIGVWAEEEGFPVAQECAEALELARDAAGQLGAHVAKARPRLGGPALIDLYLKLLLPILATDMPTPLVRIIERGRFVARAFAGREPYSRSKWALYSAATHHDWLIANEAREKLKREVADLFQRWDVLLAPVAPSTAFPHAEKGDAVTRRLLVDGVAQPFHVFHGWIALATVCHLPAAVIPVRRGEGQLPAGIQIIGPEGGDEDVLAIAEALERVAGGFVPPPERPPGSPPPPPPPPPRPKPPKPKTAAPSTGTRTRSRRRPRS